VALAENVDQIVPARVDEFAKTEGATAARASSPSRQSKCGLTRSFASYHIDAAEWFLRIR
jgi:hypothetical protein